MARHLHKQFNISTIAHTGTTGGSLSMLRLYCTAADDAVDPAHKPNKMQQLRKRQPHSQLCHRTAAAAPIPVRPAGSCSAVSTLVRAGACRLLISTKAEETGANHYTMSDRSRQLQVSGANNKGRAEAAHQGRRACCWHHRRCTRR